MRRTREAHIIVSDDERPIGINLGYDFCAEHEEGIEHIISAFGIPTDERVWGVERRKITKVPSEFGIVRCSNAEYGDFCCLLFNRWVALCRNFEIDKFPELVPGNNEDLVAAWDEGSFGILGRNDYYEVLEQLYEAFQKLDIAILPDYRYFGSYGLSIVIASEIPDDVRQQMYEADKDQYELMRAVHETGIEKYLEKHGKKWLALSPLWRKNIQNVRLMSKKTKYPVIFWLNPHDQSKYRAGYFTVEELRQWARDKGPVMNTE